MTNSQNDKSVALSRDNITGALNRNFYENTKGDSCRKVAVLRVANLNEIREAHNQACVDKLVRDVATTITGCVRASDTIIRFSEDSFLIRFDGLPSISFLKRIEDLAWRAERLTIEVNSSIRPIVCIGAVDAQSTFEDLANHADRLSQQALKDNSRVILYSGDPDERGVPADESSRLFSITRDTLERRTNEIDALTGLPSAAVFRKRLQQIVDARSTQDRISVIHFDIENFKAYNRAYGFQGGDLLLQFLAESIRREFPDAPATRLSIDCYVVATTALNVDERISRLHDIIHDYQSRVSLELKAGVYTLDPEDSEAVLATVRAKLACDSIKGMYDRHVRHYDHELDQQISMSQHVVSNIDVAIANGYIKVFYQPLVRSITGKVCGYEALCRWDDPEFGLLPPHIFIPTLEQSHLIHKVDCQVIRHVCQDLAKLQNQGLDPIPVSINLSRLDFQLCDIYDFMQREVKAAGIDRKYIHVEVTESALDEDAAFFRPQLDRFRDAGYAVWMDDFGSGFSSLNLLKDYNFDVLKIDMAFLHGFDNNKKSHEILKSIIDMAKRLGIKTVAEGVETVEQQQFLSGIGCQMLQGYLFDKPRPYETVLLSTSLETESRSESEYYETIGSINVLSPNAMAEFNNGTDILYGARGVPLAILEKRGEDLTFLTQNEAFVEHLHHMGIENLEQALDFYNSDGAFRSILMRRLIAALRTDTEQSLEHMVNKTRCSTHVRHIADFEEEGVNTFLVMSTNLTPYGGTAAATPRQSATERAERDHAAHSKLSDSNARRRRVTPRRGNRGGGGRPSV
ncbi:MAG: GGDEF domain-containing protein [Atopobiaceae bacterium]|nr:GGDEF domain-containing protein [Atopobiaceae bacterium]